MIGQEILPKCLSTFMTKIFLLLAPHISLSQANEEPCKCRDQAIKRIEEIQTLPRMKYLNTLDGQNILLSEFYCNCQNLFPQCCLFEKFYYWQSEIREEVSKSKNGLIKHKIRIYHNCFSAFCPENSDPLKTHGDVAEFYDRNGYFMGLAVYMGEGKYCPLPYQGYEK